MTLVTIECDQTQETAVNPDHVTFLRRDIYGTAIHLTSGEHIICSLDLEEVKRRLEQGIALQTVVSEVM